MLSECGAVERGLEGLALVIFGLFLLRELLLVLIIGSDAPQKSSAAVLETDIRFFVISHSCQAYLNADSTFAIMQGRYWLFALGTRNDSSNPVSVIN